MGLCSQHMYDRGKHYLQGRILCMRPFIHVSKCLEHLGVTSLALVCFTWGLGVEWNVLSDYPISPSKSATRMLIIDHNFFFGVEKIKNKCSVTLLSSF